MVDVDLPRRRQLSALGGRGESAAAAELIARREARCARLPDSTSPATAPEIELLFRPVRHRARERLLAVSRRLRPFDHFRRHPHRQFRPWRVLHARRLCRFHAHRSLERRDRLLGRDRARRDRRRGDRRCSSKIDAVAPHLRRAGTVPVARDVRRHAGGRGPRAADLGAERPARSARAGLQGRDRSLRPARSRPTICC